MFGMSLKSAKEGFFDRAKVVGAVGKATRQVLSRFGAFVRQRAKTSIRNKKGTSPPGSPPYSHVGLLRRFILFAFDPQRQSVVIGPTQLRETSVAPRILEHGGDATVDTPIGPHPARYEPRPFMQPAFEQEKGKLPDLWRNSVR